MHLNSVVFPTPFRPTSAVMRVPNEIAVARQQRKFLISIDFSIGSPKRLLPIDPLTRVAWSGSPLDSLAIRWHDCDASRLFGPRCTPCCANAPHIRGPHPRQAPTRRISGRASVQQTNLRLPKGDKSNSRDRKGRSPVMKTGRSPQMIHYQIHNYVWQYYWTYPLL